MGDARCRRVTSPLLDLCVAWRRVRRAEVTVAAEYMGRIWQVWHHYCAVCLHLLHSFDVFVFVAFFPHICIYCILSAIFLVLGRPAWRAATSKYFRT